MWDLPGPGLKPMSPALAGGFLTTVSPGKSSEDNHENYYNNKYYRYYYDRHRVEGAINLILVLFFLAGNFRIIMKQLGKDCAPIF